MLLTRAHRISARLCPQLDSLGQRRTSRGLVPSRPIELVGKTTVGITSTFMASSSEDEFNQQIKRQRMQIGKENLHPNRSPFVEKLAEISFNSCDFQNDKSKTRFSKLVMGVGDLLDDPKKAIPKAKTNKKKQTCAQKKQEPYSMCRVQRPGITMFEMVEATNTQDKVVLFFSRARKDRTDALQSKVFRCRKRYGDKQCAKTVSLTAGTFFNNIHLLLFTAVWLLWGFARVFITLGLYATKGCRVLQLLTGSISVEKFVWCAFKEQAGK